MHSALLKSGTHPFLLTGWAFYSTSILSLPPPKIFHWEQDNKLQEFDLRNTCLVILNDDWQKDRSRGRCTLSTYRNKEGVIKIRFVSSPDISPTRVGKHIE